MKRITITGVVDIDGDNVDKQYIETILDDIRQYGTAGITNIEDVDKTPELPRLNSVPDWFLL